MVQKERVLPVLCNKSERALLFVFKISHLLCLAYSNTRSAFSQAERSSTKDKDRVRRGVSASKSLSKQLGKCSWISAITSIRPDSGGYHALQASLARSSARRLFQTSHQPRSRTGQTGFK